MSYKIKKNAKDIEIKIRIQELIFISNENDEKDTKHTSAPTNKPLV